MKNKGFSLIELLLCLGIILLLGFGSAAYLKNASRAVKKQEAQLSLTNASVNFMETLKTVPFASLANYNNQTLADGKIKIQASAISNRLYKISLASSFPNLEITTLRSDYE